jgi:hypothetical protein
VEGEEGEASIIGKQEKVDQRKQDGESQGQSEDQKRQSL